jgi:hypothetical protein
MSDDARRPRWALIALIAAVALVVVIALVAVFLRGNPVQYAEDTPEGVVQRYSQAVVDGDLDTALTYVVAEVADTCDRIETPDQMRVTLVKTTQTGDGAQVDVRITTVYDSGPLGTNEYSSDGTFRLVTSGDSWLIESAPWELAVCSEMQR